jgi:hypothetical protein
VNWLPLKTKNKLDSAQGMPSRPAAPAAKLSIALLYKLKRVAIDYFKRANGLSIP